MKRVSNRKCLLGGREAGRTGGDPTTRCYRNEPEREPHCIGRRDVERMVAFYTATVFDHQLAIEPVEAASSTVVQLSFVVERIDDLRRVRKDTLALGASQMRGLNPGNAWSVYFAEPAKTARWTSFWTPLGSRPAARRPPDLAVPDKTEAICRADPRFPPGSGRQFMDQ